MTHNDSQSTTHDSQSTTHDSGQTILIIEDTITYQQAVRRAFLAKGYAVVTASTGREGLEKIKESRPNLIVLDVLLPDLKGFEICRDIKSNLNYRNLPVMMLTMTEGDAAAQEGLKAGADAYVNKQEPIDVIVQRAIALLKMGTGAGPLIEEESENGQSEISLTDKKILLVDDDITYLQGTKRELVKEGYQVKTAMSGEESLKCLEADIPDLMLLDLKMPDLDGTDVCRRLRKNKRFQALPVVMLTASDSEEDLVRSFQSGVNDYVIKGADFSIIKLRIYSILRRLHFEQETLRIRSRLSDAEMRALRAEAEKEVEKKFSKELDVSNKRLQNEIEEREKVERSLRESYEELNKVNLELDRFVYTASHDLRAPLRGISSFASFLQEDYQEKLDDKGRDYIQEILKGAHNLSALINDLLALSRISRIRNPYEDVPISALLKEVLTRFSYDIKTHRVVVEFPKELPAIHCDRIKMTEVFANLINNAIKFSCKKNKAQPRVEIGYADKGEVHEFFVKDNGIGMDAKHHDEIFTIFRRLHTEREYEGTGAGLSIVKRVIEDHRGKIRVASELGQGSTFYFTLAKNLKKKKRLGEILIEEGLISDQELERGLKKQEDNH